MTDLRNYISQIKKIQGLKTVKTKVSTKYEIAGITAKVDGSFAVLFENIKESDFRLVANLVGTRTRFSHAVGSSETKIHEKVISAIKKAKKRSRREANSYSIVTFCVVLISIVFIDFQI